MGRDDRDNFSLSKSWNAEKREGSRKERALVALVATYVSCTKFVDRLDLSNLTSHILP